MRRYFATVSLCALLASCGLLAQTSHRQPNPTPGRPPDVFERLEKQGEPAKEKPASQAVRKQQRSANLAELQRQLPQLIELAQTLQKRLQTSDLETVLPSDLERQAKELEQVARRIRKHIHSL